LRLRLIDRKSQSWIRCYIATADTCRDCDLPDQLGEKLAALLVLSTLAVLDIRPFTVSCHTLRCSPVCRFAVCNAHARAGTRRCPLNHDVSPKITAYDNG
jgi:hypothetical protein